MASGPFPPCETKARTPAAGPTGCALPAGPFLPAAGEAALADGGEEGRGCAPDALGLDRVSFSSSFVLLPSLFDRSQGVTSSSPFAVNAAFPKESGF